MLIHVTTHSAKLLKHSGGMHHPINSHLAKHMDACDVCYHRGDIVSIETYFSEEGRLAARRDWRILNAATGEVLGMATRWVDGQGGHWVRLGG